MQITKWNFDNFTQKEVKINVLEDSPNGKEIQILMSKDSIMVEHKAPFAIKVQVLKGRIKFELSNQSFELENFDMISLEANVSHSLYAFEDSIIRLSLDKNDTIARVSGVLKKP